MEKETELYLLERIRKLEDDLKESHKKSLETNAILTKKAIAFDSLVNRLGLEYVPTTNQLVIRNTQNFSVEGLPHLYFKASDFEAIKRGLEEIW